MTYRAPITIITPTIPGREIHISHCMKSVSNQTLKVESHHIQCQDTEDDLLPIVHLSKQLNELLAGVETKWVMCLDDDDELESWHIETIWEVMKHSRADVFYSWDTTRRIPKRTHEHIECIWEENWIANSGTAIRVDLLKAINGWPEAYEKGHFWSHQFQLANFQDWALWQLLHKLGATFRCIPRETWRYNHGNWPTISNNQAPGDNWPNERRVAMEMFPKGEGIG